MREYELIIDEALQNGLSPLDKITFNAQVLDECLGFKCFRSGLGLYEPLENPLTTIDFEYNWPFPQVVSGEGYRFLIIRESDRDTCYIIEDDLTPTWIGELVAAIVGWGTLVEVADFGEYAIMVNGVAYVYWDVTTSTWQLSPASATIPLMRTICNFKGQAVGGNITSAWHDCDETFYIWSKIGSLDFTPEQDNTAGYRRCPFGGEVLNVRRLGDHVIGYSSKGITRMSPVGEPAVTFSFHELDGVGLVNQGAVAGNYGRHVYVGTDYRLKTITSEGIKDLGYKLFMEELKGEDIIVTYNQLNDEFYIGNSSKTYLYTLSGLTEVPQHPSAVWSASGESYMIPDAEDDFEPMIATAPFDMGYRGRKHLVSIESDLVIVDRPQAAADYYTSPISYGTTPFKPMNNEGIAFIGVSGNAFRARIKFDPTYDGSTLSYIKVRYKMEDLRGIRGVYAPSPRGQS